MQEKRNLHIALLVNRESVYGQGIIRGVMSYVRPSKTWKVSIGRLSLKDIHKMVALKPDGMIAEVFSPRAAGILTDAGIPCIDVANVVGSSAIPKVCADSREVGRLAAAHFLERGFSNFAYIGGKTANFAKLRQCGFAERLREHGHECAVFFKKLDLDFYGSNVLGEGSKPLHQWLLSLSKPVAVFACNDAFALIVNETCRQLGLHVPHQVAILGVDNDEQYCQLETPATSSVVLPLRQIGFEGVRALEKLIHGTPHPPRLKALPPVEIILRESTNTIAFKNEKLSEAIQFIRDNAHRPISVDEVCRALYLSRRWLENNMKNQIGHSPLTEIHRVHVERAKTLLTHGGMTLPEIAMASGFRSPERMSILFKKLTGVSPSKYRKAFSALK
ncbi:MAG: DNA-binding transcriptional regulator [Planctomycetota bacterium]